MVFCLAIGVAAWLYWPTYQAALAKAEYEKAAKAKDWPAALASAERWAAVRPDAAEPWLEVAEASRQLRQFEKTAEALGRLPDGDSRTVTALALRGDLLLSELRQPSAAIANWQRMLKTAPAADLPHQRLIYVYAMTLQRTALRDQIRLAIELECEPPEAYVYLMLLPSLQFSDGLIKTTNWLKNEPGNRDLRVAQAVFAARTAPSATQTLFETRNALVGDRSLIGTCREDYPDHPELLAVLIDQAIYGDEVEQVEQLLKEVSPAADDDSRFWRYRGWLALMQRNPQGTVECCQRALDVHPLDWKARHLLADAERLLKDNAAERNSEIAARGKQLERSFLEMANPTEADAGKLKELCDYARDCGDELVTTALERRLGLRPD